MKLNKNKYSSMNGLKLISSETQLKRFK